MAETLKLFVRESVGKKKARQLRHDGFVPGVLYGGDSAPTAISIELKDLNQYCFSQSFFSKIFEVDFNGKKENIIAKDITFHPVTDVPWCVDFMRITKGSKVRVNVKIEFVNTDKSIGMKKGGVLNIVVHQIECICDVSNIPDKFIVDLGGKDIGASFSIADIAMPNGVSPVHASNVVIATIVSPRTGVSDDTNQQDSDTTQTTEAGA